MTITAIPTTAADRRAHRRADRAAEIAAAATVRSALGQAVVHRQLPNGRCQVQLYDRDAGRLRAWEGATLAEAIAAAKEDHVHG
jgi:hypothetical protein